MKNFKKVISAVIALAMVISSFTAVSASKFTDVADTANYAEAVEVLAALGIVNGTEENGTLVFKPENTVTRAEAATMIVGALNMADEATASAGASQFADVNTQAAWASGYVNVGVAQGFIKGYDASTFGPLDNVTYAQLCVMLTTIAGYGDYAAANGGWPTGYTTMAATLGMGKGVAVANDTALTKGQVAVMIYNALQAPMLGVSEFSMIGNTYEMLNGKGNSGEFKTLLSDKFGGYVATVLIQNVPASKAGLDVDEVEFDVTKADWWDDGEVKSSKPVTGEVTLFSGVDVNAAHLKTGTAVFVENEDEDLVMIYFGANGDKNTKTYDAADYVYQEDIGLSNKFAKKSQIRFGSTYVKLDEGDVKVYVNGVVDPDAQFAKGDANIDAFEAWMDMAQGTVRITETEVNKNVEYSIFLTCYEVAKVTSVDVDDDETVITVANNAFGTDVDTIKIDAEDVEDGKVTVSITKNGAKADADDIVKGDIIAFAADFNDVDNKGVLDVDGDIVILATDDTVTGVVTSRDEDDNTYTIDGKEYEVLGGTSDVVTKTLEVTLDPFGRIFSDKVSATADKYAIVLSYKNGDLNLLLADGTKKTFEETDIDVSGSGINVIEAANNATKVINRVIKYTVKTRTGELTTVKAVSPDEFSGEYNTKTGKLKGNKVTSSTLIIDAQKAVEEGKLSQASQYEVFNNDDLAANVPYVGATFGATTDTTPFIILTSVDALYGESTRFAIALRVYDTYYDEDGDACDMVRVLYEGKEQELLFKDGEAENVSEGDAFIFETDASGFVKTTYVIYDASKAADKKFVKMNTITGLKDKLDDGWTYSLIDNNAEYQYVRGFVVEVEDNAITFANWTNSLKKIDSNEEIKADDDANVVTYAFADDLMAYVYDADGEGKRFEDNIKAKAASSIKASNFAKYDQDEDGVYNVKEFDTTEGATMNDVANEAIALIVDGDVVAIYVIEQ